MDRGGTAMNSGQPASLPPLSNPLLRDEPALGVPTAGVARIRTLAPLLTPARLRLGARACRHAPLDAVLGWVEENERAARVYFVTSVGATSSCEAVRRRTRNELARRASSETRNDQAA